MSMSISAGSQNDARESSGADAVHETRSEDTASSLVTAFKVTAKDATCFVIQWQQFQSEAALLKELDYVLNKLAAALWAVGDPQGESVGIPHGIAKPRVRVTVDPPSAADGHAKPRVHVTLDPPVGEATDSE